MKHQQKLKNTFKKGKTSEQLGKCNETHNQALTLLGLFSGASTEFEQRHLEDAGTSSPNAKTLVSTHMKVSILLQVKLHRPL